MRQRMPKYMILKKNLRQKIIESSKCVAEQAHIECIEAKEQVEKAKVMAEMEAEKANIEQPKDFIPKEAE